MKTPNPEPTPARAAWPQSWRFPLNSLRAQLLIWITLPAAVVLIGVSMLEIRGHEHAMHRLVQERAASLGQAAAILIAGRIEHGFDTLADIAEDMGPSGVLPAAPVAHFPAGLLLYAPDGPRAATSPDAIRLAPDVATALAQAVASRQAGLAVTLFDAEQATWFLLQAIPIPGAGGPAVLIGALPVDHLASSALLAELLPAGAIHMWIEDGAGAQLIQLAGDPASLDMTAARTVTVVTPIPETDLAVVIHESWSALVPPLLRYEGIALLGVLMVLVVSLLSAFFGLHSIVRPLRRLDQAAGQVGWGDYDAVHKPVGGVAEIEDLRLALARMVDQVRQYQSEMRSYIGAMTLGQEEERKRLARELHDETVQALIVLNQQIEVAQRDLTRDPEQAAERLTQLHPLVNGIIADLRRQIHDLRPLYLEDLGLVTALEMLVHQTAERNHVVGDLEVVGEPPAFVAQAVELSAFRIVQEALNNVISHAHADWVHIETIFGDHALTLRIEDNGVGFDAPRHAHQLSGRGHYGLAGMQERVQLHGGRLHIESEPGKGTVITAHLPLGETARTG